MQLFGRRHSRIIVCGSELLLGRWLFTCPGVEPAGPQKDLEVSGGVGRTETEGSSSM